MRQTMRSLTTRIFGVLFLGVIAGALVFLVIRFITYSNENSQARKQEDQAKCRSLATGRRIALLIDYVTAPTVEDRVLIRAELDKLDRLTVVLTKCNQEG